MKFNKKELSDWFITEDGKTCFRLESNGVFQIRQNLTMQENSNSVVLEKDELEFMLSQTKKRTNNERI